MIRGGTAGVLTRPKQMGVPKRGKVLRAGPFVGMRDSLDPKISSDPDRAILLQNMFPLELDKPTTFYGIPGFEQAGTQLGDTGKRTGQLVYQFTKLDGTEYTVAVVGGQGIYTYNWSTETWTQVVSVANLTTATITLSETARCYAKTYTDKMLISDGLNTAFLWDGTAGAGGLTKLTNAPVFYGQPEIHYAKTFAIKDASRNVLDWSEENAPTLGYETSPYNNSWQLGQTDQEGLYAVAATNDALYYLRARSTGAIRGAVTPEFSSDGTHEGISQSVGTISPDGVIVVGERVFFIDADARPHVIQNGRVVGIYDDIRETIRGLDKSKMESAIARFDPITGLVLFGVVEIGETIPSAIIAINPTLNVPVAVWRGFTFTAMGVVKNANGIPVLMHLSDDGYAYNHGTLESQLWDFALNVGTTAIPHAVETCHLGTDIRTEKQFTRADISLRAEEDATDINVKHITPYGVSSAVVGSVTSSEYRYDAADALYDQSVWGSGVTERHLPVGLNAVGRWMRLRIDHQITGEQFGVTHIGVEAMSGSDAPQAL